VLVGADTFVEIELWARERIDWLRRYLRLETGIPRTTPSCRLFGVIDPTNSKRPFGAGSARSSRRWRGMPLWRLTARPADARGRRHHATASGQRLCSRAGLVLGQRATAKKSNEKTAIPELLSTLALEGCIVTIDAMGTQANIAQAIRDRGADYVLAAKDNQPHLADSIRDFFIQFQAVPERTPHTAAETVEKNHGRIEVRRCFAFDQLDCLAKPEQWADLKSFAVIESERCIRGKPPLSAVSTSQLAGGCIPTALGPSRAHWTVENRLHWCMDVCFRR
jgi:predicted transposase YbfD/YdcC